MEQLLKLFGFGEKEIAVYKALLEVGSARVSDIARTLRIKRTSCQEQLKRLVERGFVNSTKVGNKYYYQPEDPDRFRQIISERQFTVDRLLHKLTPAPAEPEWSVGTLSLAEAGGKIRKAQRAKQAVAQFGNNDIGGALLNEKLIILFSANQELPAIEIASKALVQFHKQLLGKRR